MANRVCEAWSSALGLSVEDGRPSVHFPQSPSYTLTHATRNLRMHSFSAPVTCAKLRPSIMATDTMGTVPVGVDLTLRECVAT